jgi:hypothetical protein
MAKSCRGDKGLSRAEEGKEAVEGTEGHRGAQGCKGDIGLLRKQWAIERVKGRR